MQDSKGSINDDVGLAWQEVNVEHIVQDQWIDFRRSAFRFPDGKVFEPFYTYSRRDYVVIVASDTEGKYLCVRQFRQGIKAVTTEFVAGGIERSDGREYAADRMCSEKEQVSAPQEATSGELAASSEAITLNSEVTSEKKPEFAIDETKTYAEDTLAAAKRELLEETGYESDEWEHLLTVPSNATIADNYAHLYVARNCRQVSGQSLDETEYLNVVKYTEEELEEMISNGSFQQVMHITAWLLSHRSAK